MEPNEGLWRCDNGLQVCSKISRPVYDHCGINKTNTST